MLSIIQKFMRTSPPDKATNDGAELLASCNLPNADDLRRQLASVEAQRDVNEARCEEIRHDIRAFLEQQAIAERRPRLQAQIDALKSQIAVAEKRRAAFVALVEILKVTDQQIAQASQRLYADVLLTSKEERRVRLQVIDGLVRLRARVAAALAVVSPLRTFHRAPDPFAALAHDLRAAADEIDRHHAPGMPRAVVPWPAGARELIDALKGGTS